MCCRALRLCSLRARNCPQGAATDAAIIHLVPPAASSYPPGARLLHGRNRDYLLVPIGQVCALQRCMGWGYACCCAASRDHPTSAPCHTLAALPAASLPCLQIMSEHYTAYFNFIEDQDQGSVELGW